MEALTYQMVPIGKTFANSKHKYSWKFRLNGRIHNIDFKYSVTSQSAEVLINGVSTRKWNHTGKEPLLTTINLDGQQFEIVQIQRGFELFYQKQPFSFYTGGRIGARGNSANTSGNDGYPTTIGIDPTRSWNTQYSGFIPSNNPNPNPLEEIIKRNTNYLNGAGQPAMIPPTDYDNGANQVGQIGMYNNQSAFSASILNAIMQPHQGGEINPMYNQGIPTGIPQNTNQHVYGVNQQVDPAAYGRQNSSGKRNINIKGSCALESQADTFMSIDFPVTNRSHQLLFDLVHKSR